jgi:hypothetical protein
MLMKKIIYSLFLFALISAGCSDGATDSKSEKSLQGSKIVNENLVKEPVILTVSESKRLIAKGLLNHPKIKGRLKKGVVIITRGSTNTYVAEEIVKLDLPHGNFLLGNIRPTKGAPKPDKSSVRTEIIIQDGKVLDDCTYIDGLSLLRGGDIVIKGANIINYKEKKAAVLIGNPTGGTAGKFLPYVENHGVKLIIPVGLEKDGSWDISLLSGMMEEKIEKYTKAAPRLWELPGELFTEIEAIKTFADVEVNQIGSGGIGGAEGGVFLSVTGSREEVARAMKIIKSVHGEPPFLKKR